MSSEGLYHFRPLWVWRCKACKIEVTHENAFELFALKEQHEKQHKHHITRIDAIPKK